MLGGGHLRTLFGGEGRGLEKEDAFCLGQGGGRALPAPWRRSLCRGGDLEDEI